MIAHGKKQYWARDRSYHYHCTLDKGENTVDADLVRLTYKSLTESGGELVQNKLRESYVSFMTTPGTYNDSYMSSTHRMFFANMQRGKPPDSCPDNDGHNVDAICGLTMLIPVALATAHLPAEKAYSQVSDCIGVTRRSSACEEYGAILTDVFREILSDMPLKEALQKVGGKKLEAMAASSDPVVA